MKALIQRVKTAQVWVDDTQVGSIGCGLLCYIGIAQTDGMVQAQALVDKIVQYRVFEDAQGKMGHSLLDVQGELLLVSQFTLMANTKKGRRPDFSLAMAPSDAKKLFEDLVQYAKKIHPKVATGRFGADMQVVSSNDGPTNFLLEIE